MYIFYKYKRQKIFKNQFTKLEIFLILYDLKKIKYQIKII